MREAVTKADATTMAAERLKWACCMFERKPPRGSVDIVDAGVYRRGLSVLLEHHGQMRLPGLESPLRQPI